MEQMRLVDGKNEMHLSLFQKSYNESAPEGMVTIQRRYIPKSDCPKWNERVEKLPPLHITSKGTIETEGAGLLQMDFANKYVGGGVLDLGCVQEEIRFVICPELLVTMLITEELDDTEALIVSGVERYSKYKGYSNSFKWTGDYQDNTPRDSSGRRMTSIVAIDALYFSQPQAQFSTNNIIRELNKAYVGFAGCKTAKNNLPAIATGNWGCGAFRGNPKLKALLQLMAAAVAGRSVVYFTFGDTNLTDDVFEMYTHFVKHETNIAHIFNLLLQYQEFVHSRDVDFYKFMHNGSKVKPLTQYLHKPTQLRNTTGKEFHAKKTANVSTDKKRPFYLDADRSKSEEDKIQGWLENEPGEEIEILVEEPGKSQNQSRDTSSKEEERSQEKRMKQSLWKILNDTDQTKTSQVRRLSALELMDEKQDLINPQIIQDCETTTDKPEKIHDTNEPIEVPSETSTVTSYRRNSSTKKPGQRKISDFFQRTESN